MPTIKHIPGAQVFTLPLHPLFEFSDVKRVKIRFDLTPEGQWLVEQAKVPQVSFEPEPYTVVHDMASQITYLLIFDAKLAAGFKLQFT